MQKRYLVPFLVCLVAGFGFVGCGESGGGSSSGGPECEIDDDCSDGEACLSQECLPTCESDEDCADGKSCKFDGVCITGCESDSDCPSGKKCNTQTNVCFNKNTQYGSCTDGRDSECETQGTYCAGETCLPNSCRSNSDCSGNNICDATGICRTGCAPGEGMCGENETCKMSTNTCEPNEDVCVPGDCGQFLECNTELDKPTCEFTGNCGGSQPDAVCDGFAEQEGKKLPWVCDEDAGECIEQPPCSQDSDCGSEEICEVKPNSRNTCREGCRCSDSENCERSCLPDEVCNAQNKCELGCTGDQECQMSGEGDVCVDQQCFRTCTAPKECETIVEDSSCQKDSDCDGLNVCNQQKNKCERRGLVCRSKSDHSVCQECNKSNQCSGNKYCETQLGKRENDETGLCKDNPPGCLKDGYGDNHALQNAKKVKSGQLPFEPMGSDRPYMCRDASSNPDYDKNQGEWWKVDAETGQVIDVTVSYPQDAGNIDLELVNSTGSRIASSIRPPGEDGGKERIVYGVPGGDTYFIHLTQALSGETTKVRYDFKVDVRAPRMCTDDGREENDKIGQAKELTAGMSYNLNVCGDDDDYFTLDAKQNQKVQVVVSDVPERLGDVDMTLFDSSDSVVKTVTSQAGGELTLEYLTQAAEELTTQLFVPSGAGRVDYNIKWTQRPNKCFDQFEANDKCSEAYELPRTTTEENYKDLSVCTDDDYYKIDLNAGDRLQLSSTYNTNVGVLQMTLFGPNSCTTLAQSQSEEDLQNDEQRLTIDYTTQSGGTFYINLAKDQGPSHIPHNLKVHVQ